MRLRKRALLSQHSLAAYILLALPTISHGVLATGACSQKELMACALLAKTQGVQFHNDPMVVTLQMNSRAKLLHTCGSYIHILNCFSSRMTICGTAAQKARLEQAKRVHKFVCSEMAEQRKELLINSSNCLRMTQRHTVRPNCEIHSDGPYFDKLESCMKQCRMHDRSCEAQIKLSQMGICGVQQIEERCGREASLLFAQLKSIVYGQEFPLQCAWTSPIPSTTPRVTVESTDSEEKTTSSEGDDDNAAEWEILQFLENKIA